MFLGCREQVVKFDLQSNFLLACMWVQDDI